MSADRDAAAGRVGRLAFVTVPELILGTLMLVGVTINFANVIGRYLFGYALHWAEETMVFITIWGVFIGLVSITYRGEHLCMDLFSSRFRGAALVAVRVLIAIVLIACCVFFAQQSYKVVTLFVQSSQVTVAAGIPKAIPHAALLIGFALTAVVALVRLRAYLTGRF